MKKDKWKCVYIILLAVIVVLILSFLIKGLMNINSIYLSELKYGKNEILNNLLMTDNTERKFKRSKVKMNKLDEVLWVG